MNIDVALTRLEEELEKITKRGMKEKVVEYLSNFCYVELDFIQRILDKEKSLMGCLKFINENAKKYLEESDEAIKIAGGFGGDVDDKLCYEWAVKYYKTPDKELYPKKKNVKSKDKKSEPAQPDKIDKNNNGNNQEQLSLGV